LHGGTSSVFAFGSNADGESWKVAISHPVNRQILATVTLDSWGLSVSEGTPTEGRKIVDPLTGEIVQRNLLAAVVLPSPTDAEAWSTALLVLGEEGLPLFERHNPNGWALLVGNEGKIWQVGKHER